MNYNQTTLKSLESTWMGELLTLTDEEIKKVLSELPDVEKEVKNTVTDEQHGEITFPHFLGEMTNVEKALCALLLQKDLHHAEICEKERENGGDFSPEHNELHELIPQLKEEMFRSIKKRFPDILGSGLQISQGGKIFAVQENKEEELPPFLRDFFESRKFGGIRVITVEMS